MTQYTTNDWFPARKLACLDGCLWKQVAGFLCCLVFWLFWLQAALAAIDNTARAVGVYNAAPVISAPSSQSIPVVAAAPQIAITKTGVLNDQTLQHGGHGQNL